MIQENIPTVQFSRPAQNKSEQPCPVYTKSVAVKAAAESINCRNKMNKILCCAQIIRQDIMKARIKTGNLMAL